MKKGIVLISKPYEERVDNFLKEIEERIGEKLDRKVLI